MVNLFNRNDGTFAQIQTSDVVGLNYSILLNTVSGSGAFLTDITSFGTSGFNNFDILFVNLIPAQLSQLIFQVQGTNGVFATSGYYGNISSVVNGVATNTATLSGIPLSGTATVSGTVSTSGISGTIRCYGPGLTRPMHATGQSNWVNQSAQGVVGMLGGVYFTPGPLVGFRIGFQTSNMTSVAGSFEVYGFP